MIVGDRLYKDDGSSISGCPAIFPGFTESDCTGSGCPGVHPHPADPELAVIVADPADEATAAQLGDQVGEGEVPVVIRMDTLQTGLHRLAHPDTDRSIQPRTHDWYRWFDDGQPYSMFRLLLLQDYSDPGETAARAGEADLPDEAEWWFELLSRAERRGAPVQRVHVVVEPLSDYMQFALPIYEQSARRGERVHILPVTQEELKRLDLPGHDFWLRNSRDLMVLRYNAAHELICGELITEPATIVRHAYWRDVALSQAMPLHDYLRRRRAA